MTRNTATKRPVKSAITCPAGHVIVGGAMYNIATVLSDPDSYQEAVYAAEWAADLEARAAALAQKALAKA